MLVRRDEAAAAFLQALSTREGAFLLKMDDERSIHVSQQSPNLGNGVTALKLKTREICRFGKIAINAFGGKYEENDD
jgi:hypothetical protein